MTTTATNSATITADLPDFASDTIDFVLLSTVAISSTEIFPGKTYTMTLDANGVGSVDLPMPDGTGTLAWLWEVSLPDGREANVSIAWSAVSQDLATILAAEQSSTTPSSVATLIANKQDKDTDATDGNMAFFSSGQTVDAGFAMSWNADDMTVNIPLNDNVTLQTGQEFVVPVDNKSGVDITNGQVVKLSGAVGNKITIELAQANNVANARQIGVATENIANNASGFVTVAGFVRDWDTSSYSEGDVLYLSLTTPGAKTTTKPIWPDIAIEVETIVKVHVSDGVSWVGSYETGAGAHEKAAAAQAAAIADAAANYIPKDAAILAKAANYEIAAGDEAKIIECTGTFTITLPDGLDTGFQVAFSNIGAGVITFSAATTLQSKSGAVTMENQYGMATAYHRGSNVWLLAGDLA